MTLAEALRYMVESEGWAHVGQHIRERAADHRNQLMHCNSWEEVLKHRAGAEALEAVLIHIAQKIEEDEGDAEVS